MRYGIEQSLNIVAVKTLTDIGPQLGFDYLQNFGFTTLIDRRTEWDGSISSDITQALALGGVTDGVTNLEITAAYATIANGGTYTKPVFYTKILDHDGNVLLENHPQTRQVIKETTAYLLTSAMVDVVTKGTGGRVNFGNMGIAGKTGTTSKDVDVWFCGFTPYYTCGAWAGYDNNVHMGKSETNIAMKISSIRTSNSRKASLPQPSAQNPASSPSADSAMWTAARIRRSLRWIMYPLPPAICTWSERSVRQRDFGLPIPAPTAHPA